MSPPMIARDRRLFAADAELAARMQAKVGAIVSICTGWSDSAAGIPQGYTYLGQFLVHDIVSRELPGAPPSNRTRALDLDSVYGAPGQFDDPRFDGLGRFRYTASSALYTKDLLRDPGTKQALIPELRNDEHPLISQLHLSIQLFHNAAIDAIRASAAGSKLTDPQRFERARAYTVATVQRIIDEEYLANVSDRIIYAAHREGRLRVFDVPATETELPFEMTHATLRFGHSQVRESYLLNERETPTKLSELFLLSGNLNAADYQGIPHDKRIDWRRFFAWQDSPSAISFDAGRRINPKIVTAMLELIEPPAPNIIKRNMDAAIRTELPSGQTVAARLSQMQTDARISPQLRLNNDDRHQEALLRSYGLWDETPLWLFTLIEASALGGDGQRLGPLGSVFLCETVRSALEGQASYRDVQAGCANEFGLAQVGTFEQLATFAEPGTYGAPSTDRKPSSRITGGHMSTYRSEILKKFVVFPETETKIVNTQFIAKDVSEDARSALIDYHPRTGRDYRVACVVVGHGDDAFLSVEPRGEGWNLKQIEFLRHLAFVPVFDEEIPGRKPVLVMVRSASGNVRLANTNWYLVHARLEKSDIKDADGKLVTHNDVILIWEYRAGIGEQPYLKPVVTCWKWASAPSD